MTGDNSHPSPTGSGLLLRKLPILSRARALAQQRPLDPQSECNVLSYGTDVYRVLALHSDGGDPDACLSLPTRLPLLAHLEAELRRSSAAADGTTEATAAAAAVAESGSSSSSSDGGVGPGAEERAVLGAIRTVNIAPTAAARPVAPTDSAAPGAGGRTAAAVGAMFTALMAQHGAAGNEGVRAYLRRVAWIEQQKRNTAPPPPGEQAWANMTEAGRVQREIQHVEAQRKRYRRERKEKKSFHVAFHA